MLRQKGGQTAMGTKEGRMSQQSQRRLITFLLVPAVLVLIAYYVTTIPYFKYTRGIYEFLVFLLLVDLAVAVPAKLRDVVTPIAVIIFGAAVIEIGCEATAGNSDIETRGFSTSDAILGWRPSAPGIYHGEKESSNGGFIYTTDYSIDAHLLRRTVSAPDGRPVAFFGDSMTFGQGLADSETLPQTYADLSGRKVPVYNFAFPGYGPQQFLRALETGMYDPMLSGASVFVYLTAGWHVERAACTPGFMARAPRYVLLEDEPVFIGACAEGLSRIWADVFVASATYHRFVEPLIKPSATDVDIYLAELRRAAELVKQRYGARLLVLYMSESDALLKKSGFTDALIKTRLQQSGIEVVDATLHESDFPPGTVLKFPEDGQPTAIANHARAALLRDKINSMMSATAIAPVPN